MQYGKLEIADANFFLWKWLTPALYCIIMQEMLHQTEVTQQNNTYLIPKLAQTWIYVHVYTYSRILNGVNNFSHCPVYLYITPEIRTCPSHTPSPPPTFYPPALQSSQQPWEASVPNKKQGAKTSHGMDVGCLKFAPLPPKCRCPHYIILCLESICMNIICSRQSVYVRTH